MTDTPEDNQPEVTLNGDGSTATVSTDPVAKDEGAELLAGKFKDPAELEKAYKELEKKLGQQTPQQPDQTPTDEQTDTDEEKKEDETKTEDDTEVDPLVELYGEAVGNALKEVGVDAAEVQRQFDENGTLTEEYFELFNKAGYPQEMVQAYMDGLAKSNAQAEEVTERQIEQIQAVAGGPEGYEEMRDWMRANLPEAELEAYDEAIATADYDTVFKAVAEMNTRYRDDVGVEGKLRGGRAATEAAGYANEAEYLEDVANPQYKTSEAFRNQVAQKLAKSPNVFVTR